MSGVSDVPIEMAALGRPFKLGMLYDCRNDKLIPGVTLWDPEELEQDSAETSKPNTEFNIVTVGEVTHNSVSLSFSAPTCGKEAVTGYRVEYCESEDCESEEEWEQQTVANTGTVTVTGLFPETEYSFRLRAVTAVGLGPATEVMSVKTVPDPEGLRRLAEELRKTCEVMETKGSLQILKVPLVEDELNIKGCARYIFGKDSMKRNCTIMVMGATGAGKSTLINGMINYILGVQWTDPYRFKLVVEKPKSQAESQTAEVTVYKVNYDDGFMIDYSITIIDTPGFGDTIERDQQITEQIHNLFSNNFGVNDIHAICFVAPSHSAELSATQRYVFDSFLSIFGKNMAENIRILVTFAGNQVPPVLEAIKKAGVACPEDDDGLPAHYKFNNTAVFAENQVPPGGVDEMVWKMGKESMRSFFNALHKTEPKSLTLTKDVLQERQRLEESVDDLQRKVKERLAKLNEIKQTENQMKKHKLEIEINKDFKLTVKVTQVVQEDIQGTKDKKTEGLLAFLKQDYKWFKDSISGMVHEATELINRLKETALKPNPLSAPDYIDMLIESEKKQQEPGWKKRVASLEEIKQKAEIIETVEEGGSVLLIAECPW